MNQRTAEVRLLVEKPPPTKDEEVALFDSRKLPVGVEEDPVKAALRSHRLCLVAIVFFTATHRVMCAWWNVSFLYVLALHPYVGMIVNAQFVLHLVIIGTGMAMQGAVKAAVHVQCMSVPGIIAALLAVVVDLVGVYASVTTVLQVQFALELTLETAQEDNIATFLANDIAPGVVTNMSMTLGIAGSSGLLAGVIGAFTSGYSLMLASFAKTKKEIAALNPKKRRKKKKRKP